MRKRTRNIFLGAALPTVALLGYGLYFYFKPMKDIGKQEASYHMPVSVIIREFEDSPEASDTKFRDKVIQFQGAPKNQGIQIDSNSVIFDEGGATILVATLSKGEKYTREKKNILVKGIYTGYIQGDSMFGTPNEIKIDRCFILEE